MNFMRFNPPDPYPTVFLGEYTIPDGVKPYDILVRYPLEWLVLERDEQNKKALLLAKHVIAWEDFGKYLQKSTGALSASWEKSDLKKWLNTEFYENAFSSDEKQMIISTGKEVNDGRDQSKINSIFLLSVKEVKKYFASEDEAVAHMLMIASVYHDGSEEKPIRISCDPATWWTRSEGEEKGYVICVNCRGEFFESDANCDETGVRPAMWVKL